mmetsp:Transcript_28440/g.55688  ORF Transcript_28440/g.55688 Transcript_28440/m.55688 type:complete len:214 (+) Transcript_28440:821-1462(+)
MAAWKGLRELLTVPKLSILASCNPAVNTRPAPALASAFLVSVSGGSEREGSLHRAMRAWRNTNGCATVKTTACISGPREGLHLRGREGEEKQELESTMRPFFLWLEGTDSYHWTRNFRKTLQRGREMGVVVFVLSSNFVFRRLRASSRRFSVSAFWILETVSGSGSWLGRPFSNASFTSAAAFRKELRSAILREVVTAADHKLFVCRGGDGKF